jgi:hypothetical protein
VDWKLGVRTTHERGLKLGVALLSLLAVLLPWPHPFVVGRCAAPLWELPHDSLAYLYATHLEQRWVALRPRSRSELEPLLHLYSVQNIAPAESCWGARYVLAPGQVMTRYLIAWHAPLDVVYDADGAIRAIFTSYE